MERDTVRRTILGSRHLGAHGLGYNAKSQAQLGKMLSPETIPTLVDLLMHDKQVRTGAIFGLASQCGATVEYIRTATANGTVPFSHWRELQDALGLIEHGAGCLPTDRQRATD